PIGNVLNVITGVSKLPFDQAKGIFPYMFMLLNLMLFIFFPALILEPFHWLQPLKESYEKTCCSIRF
ncbi:hypothetical protein INT80_10650, partial [Gallibacterium anatis]|nr:hypothetical protein [Gallibacterium anatis]